MSVCLVCIYITLVLSLSVSFPKKQGSKKVENFASKACAHGRSGGGRSRQPGVYVCVTVCVLCLTRYITMCVTHSLSLLVSAPKKRDNSVPEVDGEWYNIEIWACHIKPSFFSCS